ncbi:MAG: glycoside hydrolase family 15 protein [Deltaproteobacteria bacterium]|nr:glycoside hydrolase family 15 protein [Deltaproteobacteria bacterium]
MDLFSLGHRLATPFRFGPGEDQPLPIGAHGAIGDGHTCALVRADGAIDWLCLPRFDSPSVFAELLDGQGGAMTIQPACRPFESLQQYEADTNVLWTEFRVPGQGLVRLTDYMPWQDDPRASIHEVHRRIECLEGEVELALWFDPRFDYGATPAAIEPSEHGLLAKGSGSERLAAVLGGPVRWAPRERGGVATRLSLKEGERRWLVLSWDAPRPEPLAAYRPYEQLRITRQQWREWTRRIRYDGARRNAVVRSALCLKMLSYAPTGAMVAAPTTSLPEWLGGQRNWDYRFTWTRDTAMAIRAANRLGCRTEARDFFHFVRDNMDTRHGLEVMYAIDGTDVPEERCLEHLAGYRGSGPVRIGNGARDQLQLDTAGALLDAAYLYEQNGGSLTLRAWRRLRDQVELVRQHWRDPDDGIWEPRGRRRHNVHSKLMSWVAFRRGAQLASRFGHQTLQAQWAAAADEAKAEILDRGLDPDGRHFVNAYGERTADAALLLIPVHELLPADHPLVEETVRQVVAELSEGPFLHRYRIDDGVGGAEGAFVLCGFWLVEALTMAGHIDRAREIFEAHVDSANHLELLAEELNPATGELLGNFPQAFSHLGLINAAQRIDDFLRRKDLPPTYEARSE